MTRLGGVINDFLSSSLILPSLDRRDPHQLPLTPPTLKRLGETLRQPNFLYRASTLLSFRLLLLSLILSFTLSVVGYKISLTLPSSQ